MDSTKENDNPNPKEGVNFFSELFFTYTIDMFKKGYQKTFEFTDLYNPLNEDRSKELGDRLEKEWETHLKSRKRANKRPLLALVILKTFKYEYLLMAFILALSDLVLRIAQPIFLKNFLQFFRPETEMTPTDAMYNAIILVAINGGTAILINQYIFRGYYYGMRVRAAVCSLIYRKALKLSRTAIGETASGKVVNLLSNDVSRFELASILLNHMWVAPTCTGIVVYLLWQEAGYAGLMGMIPVIIVVPIQSYAGRLSSKFRRETAYKTDERVRLMDEIIHGIQVIKMYAWENTFEKLIRWSRVQEIKKVTKLSYVRGVYMSFNLFTTRIALFSALLTMVLSGLPITATSVFVFTSYFNVLAHTMGSMFVRGISEMAESLVAIKRLTEFLMNDEFEDTSKSNISHKNPDNNRNVAIQLEKLTAKWNKSYTTNALEDVSLRVIEGGLLGVIGPVGSGKSSLLQTLLGELDVTSGDVIINGKLSYASQEPWVFAASIRQNIIFGKEYEKKRYNEVIKACALETDFKQFPKGDKTIVGDRGASLSGGQKARINLARAVYRDADIYLLDDPLSAVDVHVGKHLYKECIEGYLKNKTRVLVTHQVDHLKNANHIVILDEGRVETQGSFKLLSNNQDVHYAKLLSRQESVEPEQTSLTHKRQRTISRSKSISVSSLHSELSCLTEEEINEEQTAMLEESSKGKVHGSLFMKYLNAGGNYCFSVFVITLYVLTQLSASSVDYFVSFWCNLEEKRRLQTVNASVIMGMETADAGDEFIESRLIHPQEEILFSTETCVYIYAGLIVALAITAFARAILFYKLAMLSSQKLHDNMFRSIVSAVMRFFDTNPSGRILNRFAKDIGSIDELLPKTVLDAAQVMLLLIGSLILVAVVNPYLLIPLGVISLFFEGMRIIYLRSSMNIRRLEGAVKSPVFTHLNASIQGLTTIRAYDAQGILTKEFDKHQDLHTSAWFMYIAACAAFGFYLDILCFIFSACVIFSFLTFAGDSPGGEVGLAITQAFALTGFVQWGIRQNAEVSNQLTAVERVLEYTNLEREPQPLVPKTPPKNWPEYGKVQFKKLGLRYSTETNLVLKDLNILIQPQEKVGIVGRTGAGKSSLIAAIFRLAIIEGQIEIDDVDTETINLQELRSKISIIPQDPVLFSGTLRYNLDPFEEYPDDVLYKALEDVELKDSANIINKLENRVMDRGSNYSVGQRQLICLARAIIRKNKVLMLDEATANVDPQTDALIQKTIRQKFAECTVLTVAHRLNTIMDSDKVVVMDQGTIVEFNHPHVLLENTKGIFYEMVQSTGQRVSEQLKQIAKTSYLKKLGIPESVGI